MCQIGSRRETNGPVIISTSTHHILVVDDDPALLRVVQLSLQSEGFQVTTAKNGVEALERMEQGEFDAIVLDLQMPRMDGRTFYKEMRARGSSVPVLILSAFGAETARAEMQAEAAFNKPFDPDILIETVQNLIITSRPDAAQNS